MVQTDSIKPELMENLKAIVGTRGYLTEAESLKPYLCDWLKLHKGKTPIVLRPSCTDEVCKIVRLCAQAAVAVVPYGGNTSLLGGSVPDKTGNQVVISLERMNNVREIDAKNYTMTVEAGCVLAQAQESARDANLFFPLSLGAEGSCQIGGNLSTNAGGTAVLRYGNARDLTLGLEVVLPDGRLWNGLRSLRKNNTGYDLRQLFIGAEGTLGIITAAVLKLFPQADNKATALVSLSNLTKICTLLDHIRHQSGDLVTGFEYIHGSILKLESEYIPNYTPPLMGCEHAILIELSSSIPNVNISDILETSLTEAFEAGFIDDAVVASSLTQRDELWGVRSHRLSEAVHRAGPFISCDVSVPVSSVPEFIAEASCAVTELCEGIRLVPCGHAGDGNIHFDMLRPVHMSSQEFMSRLEDLTAAVYDVAQRYSGSFSAEHGIGQLKLKEMSRYRDNVELDLLRSIKHTLDPRNVMNPGKLVPSISQLREVAER